MDRWAPLRNSRDPGQELWPSVPLFSAQDSSEPFVFSLARQAWGRRGRQIPDPLGLGDGGDIGDIDDVDDIHDDDYDDNEDDGDQESRIAVLQFRRRRLPLLS